MACKESIKQTIITKCRSIGEHSAIHSTFIKLPLVIKIIDLSIFEWLFYTGFTVYIGLNFYHCTIPTHELGFGSMFETSKSHTNVNVVAYYVTMTWIVSLIVSLAAAMIIAVG